MNKKDNEAHTKTEPMDRLQAIAIKNPTVTYCPTAYALNSITPAIVKPTSKGRTSD